MMLGYFKKCLEPYVGIPSENFKVSISSQCINTSNYVFTDISHLLNEEKQSILLARKGV